MSFAFELAQARARNILHIAQQYGAQLKKSGAAEYAGPCPVCGGSDRFSISTRKQVFNCRGCGKGGDVVDLIQHISGLGFLEAVRDLVGGSQTKRANVRVVAQTPPKVTTTSSGAGAMWREGVEPRGTIVERYLNSRGLDLDEGLAGEVLRYHRDANAMLGLFRDITGDEPRAISRTFLTKEGTKLGRKFLGFVGGCAVKLDPEEEVLSGLHIGEGIETSMSARQMGLRPTWALGSAGAIAKFPLLHGVECLSLLREKDEANKKAAAECAVRWHDAGREVYNVWADNGGDLNDELRAAR